MEFRCHVKTQLHVSSIGSIKLHCNCWSFCLKLSALELRWQVSFYSCGWTHARGLPCQILMSGLMKTSVTGSILLLQWSVTLVNLIKSLWIVTTISMITHHLTRSSQGMLRATNMIWITRLWLHGWKGIRWTEACCCREFQLLRAICRSKKHGTQEAPQAPTASQVSKTAIKKVIPGSVDVSDPVF